MRPDLIELYMAGSPEAISHAHFLEQIRWNKWGANMFDLTDREFELAQQPDGFDRVAEVRRVAFRAGSEELARIMPSVGLRTAQCGVRIRGIDYGVRRDLGDYYWSEVLSSLRIRRGRFDHDPEIATHEAHVLAAYLKKSFRALKVEPP